MAPGDVPQRCVQCFERITALETKVEELEAEKAEASKRRYEWVKTFATIVFTFLLSGGGLLAWLKSWAESKGWIK